MNIRQKNEQALIAAVSKAVLDAHPTEEEMYELTLPNAIPAVLVTEFDQHNWGAMNGDVYIRPESDYRAVLETGSRLSAQASFTVSIRRIPNHVNCGILHIRSKFAREWKAINA